MARPLRVEFAGAVYHVMARGNECRDIVRDDKDRQRFLDTLAEAVERFGLRLHAFCLMGNHYHLVLGTPHANLSRALGWLQTTYTVRFNARHRRRGHLFQGRFKAELVEADEYGQWLVEYVHLNPVRPRAKTAPVPVERAVELAQYRWSSHRAYAGLARQRLLAPVEPGDILVVGMAGAYGFAMSSQYNSRPRAAEVLMAGGHARLVRRRETVADIVFAER